MKNLKFKRYNSIENTYQTKTINTIVEQGKSQGTWVVEEKVHGANFSIWFDGNEFRCAKKSGFIKEDENFFNYKYAFEKYKENVRNLFNHLKTKDNTIKTVVVFGELFGGNYPHEDVENGDHSSVQKGLFYSPLNDFYAFDIKIGYTDIAEEFEFQNVDVCNELFEEFGFFYARPLFEGTLEECLNFNNLYITLIPKWLGLPEIENNNCEGNVIKPKEVKFFWTGSRIILKNKNEKFSEKKNNNRATIKKVVEISDEANLVLSNAITFVTENRLRNVISHVGEIGEKEFGKLMNLLNKDTFEDFLKEHKEEFIKLDKNESKIITKRIGQENANIIRDNFIKIVNGEF